VTRQLRVVSVTGAAIHRDDGGEPCEPGPGQGEPGARLVIAWDAAGAARITVEEDPDGG
jgi:hypothetical protein